MLDQKELLAALDAKSFRVIVEHVNGAARRFADWRLFVPRLFLLFGCAVFFHSFVGGNNAGMALVVTVETGCAPVFDVPAKIRTGAFGFNVIPAEFTGVRCR